MFRTVHILNISLGLIAVAAILTVIVVKSTIANETQSIRTLTTELDAAHARRDALQAEWARLQHRSNILALGQALFNNGVEEIAEEIHANEIPMRSSNYNGEKTALDLFKRALGNDDLDTLDIRDETSADFVAQLIVQDLGIAENNQ